MSEENLIDEQQYWLAMLSELGSKPVEGGSQPAYSEAINEYQYLDVSVGESGHDIPMQDFSHGHDTYPNAFLERSTMPSFAAAPYEGESGRSSKADDQFSLYPTTKPDYEDTLSFSRIKVLKKYSQGASDRDQPDSAVWGDHYPAAYEAIKNDLVFEKFDGRPVDYFEAEEQEVKSDGGTVPSTPVSLVPAYAPSKKSGTSSPPSSEESISIEKVCVPESTAVDAPSQAVVLSAQLVKHVSVGVQMTHTMAISTLVRTTQQLSVIASYALFQFVKMLQNNYYISSVVGCVSESNAAIQEQLDTIRNILHITLLGEGSVEQKHLRHIQHSMGWEMVFWRYSMSTLTWQQRQLLEETKDNLASDEAKLKEQLASPDRIYNMESSFFEIMNLQAQAAEDIQYMLARHFTPKPLESGSVCHVCERSFGITLFMHHCRNCSKCVCDADSRSRRPIYRYGMVTPVRVCDTCCAQIDEVHRRDEIMWKDRRLKAYEEGKLIAYFHPRKPQGGITDNVKEYSLIVARNALSFSVPTKAFFETIDRLRKIGMTSFANMMLQKDYMDNIETLKMIVGINEEMFKLTLYEMTTCIYYVITVNRGIRGCAPDSEQYVHKNTDEQMSLVANTLLYESVARGNDTAESELLKRAKKALEERNQTVSEKDKYRCVPAKDADLSIAIKYSALALNIIYHDDPVEMQMLATKQDLQLLFTHSPNSESHTQHKLKYGVFAVSNRNLSGTEPSKCKEVMLVLRTDHPLEMLATIIHAACVPFPPSGKEIFNCLCGRRHNDHNAESTQESAYLSQFDLEKLYPHSPGYVLPYFLDTAVCLLEELGPALLRLHLSGCHITLLGHSLAGGIAAVMNYLLLPFFNSRGAGASSSFSNVNSVAYGAPNAVSYEIADYMKDYHLNIIYHDDIVPRLNKQSIHVLLKDLAKFRHHVLRHQDQDWREVMTRAMHMWKAPTQADDAFDNTVQTIEEDAFIHPTSFMADANDNNKTASKFLIGYDEDAVLIDTEDNYNTYCMGKLLHIYSNRGQLLVSEVSNNFPEIRKVSVHGNMFTDHSNVDILNALLEARAVRKARLTPPCWTSYQKSTVCQNCQNSFTWHSNFKGTLEEYRERYNCFHCGSLVCGPCSKQQRSIPKYGMMYPKRICDRCFMSGDYADL